jgi:hypothetical protein
MLTQTAEETAMIGKNFVVLAGVTVFGVSIATSAAGKEDVGDRRDRTGFVVPCSLDGVNPVYHPEVFSNPAVAAQYGFIRSRDGTWHVVPNCRR